MRAADSPTTAARIGPGIAYGAASGAAWGLVFLAPELVRDFSPLQLAAGRYLAYGLFAAVLIAPRLFGARGLLRRLGRTEWWALATLSLLGNTLYYVLLAQAVQLGGMAMTALVIGFLPVAVTLAGRGGANAVPLRRLAPWLLLGAAGIVCIGWQSLHAAALPGTAARPGALLGFACAVCALVCWSAYAVMNGRWLARRADLSAHDWSLLTGLSTGAQALLLAVPAFALPLLGGSGTEGPGAEGWLRFIGVVAVVALLASVVGNACWNQASRLLPATMIGQMILFETVFALLYGFAWERRGPTPLEALALVFVTASVLGSVRAHRAGKRPG